MWTTFLWPLYLSVLVVLHVLFALGRLRTLLGQLPALLRSQLRHHNGVAAALEEDEVDMEEEQRRWKKTPKHLAVLLHPGAPLLPVKTWLSSRRKEARQAALELVQLRRMTEDMRRLVRWCDQLGVPQLSVYDEQGILDRYAPAAMASLSSSCLVVSEPPITSSSAPERPLHSFRVASSTSTLKSPTAKRVRFQSSSSDGTATPPRGDIDSGCGISDVGIETPASTSFLTINILSRRSGRPHLASIARQLAENKDLGDSIEEAIEAGSFSEPDLLLVLGGPYLRLRGFPPWQIRLTEMYHHPSPAWLPPPALDWPILRRALDVYGGAEMRLGR